MLALTPRLRGTRATGRKSTRGGADPGEGNEFDDAASGRGQGEAFARDAAVRLEMTSP